MPSTQIQVCPIGQDEKKEIFAPGREAHLLIVKLDPGKTPQHFAEFFDRVDDKLLKLEGKKRHDMDIHELKTYVLEGNQLAVLWDAPSKAAADKFLAVWLKAGKLSLSADSVGSGSDFRITSSARY